MTKDELIKQLKETGLVEYNNGAIYQSESGLFSSTGYWFKDDTGAAVDYLIDPIGYFEKAREQ